MESVSSFLCRTLCPVFFKRRYFLLNRKTRNILCAVCAVAVLGLAVACGKTGSDPSASQSVSSYGTVDSFDYSSFDYSDGLDDNGHWSGVKALDYVTLPEDFASIALSKSELEPSEVEIQLQIDSLLSQYASAQSITGRAAQLGDIANIDYVGTVDGIAFTGGTYSGYDLTLGSGSFIDDFEDQIVGHNIGETFDVIVTFPDGYGDSTDAEGKTLVLSGKEAVFSVTLNALSEQVTPELTDAWVDATFGITDDLHTAQAVRDYFANAMYTSNLDNAVMDYLLENSKFADELPSQIAGYYIRMFLNYHSQLAAAYGLDLTSYAQAKGYADPDAMLADSDAYFAHLVKQDLLFQAAAEQLQIAPTQEQIDAANASYAATYGEKRSALNALQITVLDTLEAGAVIS